MRPMSYAASIFTFLVVFLVFFDGTAVHGAEIAPDWAFVGGRADLRLDGETVDLRLEVELLVTAEGWHAIPLVTGRTVLLDAELGDGRVHLDGRRLEDGSGRSVHRLLVREKGLRRLRVDMRCDVASVDGARHLELALPAVPSCSLHLHARGRPFRARLGRGEAVLSSSPLAGDEGEHGIAGTLPGGGALDLLWWEPVEGRPDPLPPRIELVDARVQVEPGRSIVRARLASFLDARDAERRMILPVAAEIVALRDGEGRGLDWRVRETASRRTVRPLRPASERATAWEIEYVLPAVDGAPREIVLPFVEGARSQHGTVAFFLPDGLEAAPPEGKGLSLEEREGALSGVDGGEEPRFVRAYSFGHGASPWLLLAQAEAMPRRGRMLRSVEARTVMLPDGRSLTTARYLVDDDGAEDFEFDVKAPVSVHRAFVEGRPVEPAERRNGDSGVTHLVLPAHGSLRSFEIELAWFVDHGPPAWLRSAAIELPRLKGVGDLRIPVLWHLDLDESRRLVHRLQPNFQIAARDADWKAVVGEAAFQVEGLVLRPVMAPPPRELVRMTWAGEFGTVPGDPAESMRFEFETVDLGLRRWTALPFFLLGVAGGAFLLLAHRREGQFFGLSVPLFALLGLLVVRYWGDDWMILLETAFAGAFAAGLVGLAHLAMKRDAHLGETRDL